MSTFRDELKKGAFINFLGILGKIAGPSLLIVVNQFYGTAVFGIYITANMIIELVISFLTNGFKDGAIIYVSKYAEQEDGNHKLYQSLANAFSWSILLGLISLAVIHFFGEFLLNTTYSPVFAQKLLPTLLVMSLAIPFMAFERIVFAATQGQKEMKFEAIANGGLRPSTLLLFSILYYFINQSSLGIAYAYLSSQLILFMYGFFVYSNRFSWKSLFYELRNFSINKELVNFAIPQSLNSTLTRFITGIDILMLPIFGATDLMIGLYGTGTSIVREVRQIKLAFSGAFNPHIVRFFRDNDFKTLSEGYSLTSNWIASVTIPVLIVIGVLHHDLLNWISSNPLEDSLFMLFLLPVPYFYSSFSLAANIVVMTGHSKYVLLNSFLITILNISLNIVFIPLYGLTGAALASSIATFFISLLEMFEARKLAQAKLNFKTIYKPHLAGLISLTLAFLLITFTPIYSELITRIILIFVLLLTFGVSYTILDFKLVKQRWQAFKS